MSEDVILVDKDDNKIGTEEKMAAHKKALLHRAFSILVFNEDDELLIHKRAKSKYHCPGLWTNTCCSHQRIGETTEKAAHRRLKEEMGFDTELKELFKFQYKVEFSNGLTENEIDHVLIGRYDSHPVPDPAEVDSFRWISLTELGKDMNRNPAAYTPWFRIIILEYMDRILAYLSPK